MKTSHRGGWSALGLVALVACIAIAPHDAFADTTQVRIAQQFGVNYLPLLMMKKHQLVEKQARAAALGDVQVTWTQFGSGAAMNDALLADTLDFASGGVGPLLRIWDKSKGTIDIKGVASLGSMPLYLTTTNPDVKIVADFTSEDRIALPAVKVSIQAIVLEMAAAKALGEAAYDKLDPITVSMRHPDAMIAMLGRGTEITAHFANAPFQEQELASPGVHKVLSSYDVAGRSTLNSLYTTAKFHHSNPKVYRAVLAALREAIDMINRDKKAAARTYVEEEHSKLSPQFIARILESPDFIVTSTPEGIMKYASFMYRTKSITHEPASWKDVYFPEIHGAPGS
ncbi:MAG TPA: ABC transporter substrate-binding protein [Casimicrobiaceae bacterium]|nr:ABC transporter substrate-binding protein [Casimicrobiaceae bacterium]